MLRLLSIRSRLSFLSVTLVLSLILTNLLLINQTRHQGRLIIEQAHNIGIISDVYKAVQNFGDLKYWLKDLAVSQLAYSAQRASVARDRLELQLASLETKMPEAT